MLMTRIDTWLATWLATRRASGIMLELYERHLHQFAEFSAARGEDHVRAESTVAWASQKATPGQRERHYLEVLVHGKGRKERALLLWKEVGDAIRGAAACLELFLTAVAQPMTRSGFAYILRKHVRVARVTCPSLVDRSVSPHVLHATRAHWIRSGPQATSGRCRFRLGMRSSRPPRSTCRWTRPRRSRYSSPSYPLACARGSFDRRALSSHR